MVVTYTRSGLQSLHLSLWCPSERLSAKLDGELDKKSDTMNEFYFVCYCLAVFRFFLDCTENVMYFSVFLPNTQTSFQTLDYEVVVIIRKVMKHHRNFLLYFISQNANAMRSPLIFLCVMAETLDLKAVLLFMRVFINSCLHMWQIFCTLFSFLSFFLIFR